MDGTADSAEKVSWFDAAALRQRLGLEVRRTSTAMNASDCMQGQGPVNVAKSSCSVSSSSNPFSIDRILQLPGAPPTEGRPSGVDGRACWNEMRWTSSSIGRHHLWAWYSGWHASHISAAQPPPAYAPANKHDAGKIIVLLCIQYKIYAFTLHRRRRTTVGYPKSDPSAPVFS